MKLNDIEKRVEQLIQKGNQLLASQYRDKYSNLAINESAFMGLKTATLSLILKIYDKSHPFYTEIEQIVYYSRPSSVNNLISILTSINEEITGGWIFTTKGLVSAEIFADFMDMAEHLLTENFKDPAAVMIGSVLEEHLRQLCQKNSIDIETIKKNRSVPKKADLLNSELTSNKVYNKLDQKNITAFLDLRNKAAHGKYSDYTKKQVELMYNGVMDFMIRNSI